MHMLLYLDLYQRKKPMQSLALYLYSSANLSRFTAQLYFYTTEIISCKYPYKLLPPPRKPYTGTSMIPNLSFAFLKDNHQVRYYQYY